MPQQVKKRPTLFSHAFKLTAGAISGLAALVTVLTYARQEGVIGPLATVTSPVAYIRLSPYSDTAYALGDTLHFAAIATDTNGAQLPAPQLTWTVTNTEVAEARTDGSVIATGAGETSVIVTAGRTTSQARVFVRPRVTLLKPASDSVVIPEGESTSLIAVPFDAHGKIIRGLLARWRSLDTTLFTVDSLGLAIAVRPGIAVAEAQIQGISTQQRIRITPVLGSLTLGAGADQHAEAGRELPSPVAVRTLSRQRQPLAGVLVRGTVDAGHLAIDTVTSDGDGIARFRWTLGDRPGPQHFTARADEIDSTLAAAAEADPVPRNTQFVLVDSLGVGPAGADLPAPVTVRLTDTLGQVLSDVPVRWLGLDGSRISGLAARTDSLGLARATWTLGPKVGRNRAKLIAGPGSAPAFALETRSAAGAPTKLVVRTGDHQRTTVTRVLDAKVVVTDAQGNPVAGFAVTGETGSGSIALADAATLADGSARIRWTVGPTSGDQTATLHAGTATATLSATVLPGPATQVEIVAPTISIAASPSVRVTAQVSDSLGNPIQGVVVQPRLTTGSATPLRATTDVHGRVNFTWTFAKRPGDQTITIHAAGVRVDATKTVRKR